MQYAEIFEKFPPELRSPIARLVDALKEELGVRRTDFEELKSIVRDLGQAQQRTELRLEELAGAQKELTQAQQRTEVRLEELTEAQKELVQAQQRTEVRLGELAQAQQRTEVRMEELVQAQQRTEVRLGELAQAQQRTEVRMEELAQAQQRTEIRLEELAQAQQRTGVYVEQLAQAQQRTQDELTLFRRTFTSQIGGLGARWGLQTEEAFRQGMRSILQEVGFTTERFLEYDSGGEVFGYAEQVELDVVIKNGKSIVVEIKSALDKANTYLFDRKVAFYVRKTGRIVDRKLIVTPYADNRAKEVGLRLGVEICTDIAELQ
ncbi:MAG: DUF3782 domain-containing protein [Candidatus Binatia bacterium]